MVSDTNTHVALSSINGVVHCITMYGTMVNMVFITHMLCATCLISPRRYVGLMHCGHFS